MLSFSGCTWSCYSCVTVFAGVGIIGTGYQTRLWVFYKEKQCIVLRHKQITTPSSPGEPYPHTHMHQSSPCSKGILTFLVFQSSSASVRQLLSGYVNGHLPYSQLHHNLEPTRLPEVTMVSFLLNLQLIKNSRGEQYTHVLACNWLSLLETSLYLPFPFSCKDETCFKRHSKVLLSPKSLQTNEPTESNKREHHRFWSTLDTYGSFALGKQTLKMHGLLRDTELIMGQEKRIKYKKRRYKTPSERKVLRFIFFYLFFVVVVCFFVFLPLRSKREKKKKGTKSPVGVSKNNISQESLGSFAYSVLL